MSLFFAAASRRASKAGSPIASSALLAASRSLNFGLPNCWMSLSIFSLDGVLSSHDLLGAVASKAMAAAKSNCRKKPFMAHLEGTCVMKSENSGSNYNTRSRPPIVISSRDACRGSDADVTYLKQDFPVLQPVSNHDKWP